jgi:hypothetical protein
VVALLLVAIHRRRRVSERQLFIQAWHLRQLMPQRNRPGSIAARAATHSRRRDHARVS